MANTTTAVLGAFQPLNDMLPSWTGVPITPQPASATVWLAFIASAVVSIVIQTTLNPSIIAKAEQLEIKSKSTAIGMNDVVRAPTFVQPLFTATWALFGMGFNLLPMWYGFSTGVVFVLCTAEVMLALDLLITDAPALNLVYLKRNGFSFWYVAFLQRFVMILAAVGPAVAASDHLVGVVPRLDLGVVIGVIGTLALADVAFYPCHKALHRVPFLAAQHVAHHCAKAPCFHCALTFQPLDLMIEFTFPNLVIQFIAIYVMRDPWMLAATSLISIPWYGLDHDHWLGLPHTKHHLKINDHYWAYFPLQESDPSLDKVKPLVG
eukprot:m.169131 g.169131  ORF g.169131 m.169131 type:complete len:321 (+) comp24153_c1_seq5:368-1330(+)